MAAPIFKTIPEQLERRLTHEILSGLLEPGQPLREQELSKRFGVSRGPVREVLNRLTQQGLVVAEPNKGVRIASQPSAALRPLLVELRKRTELFVLDSIFEDISEENLADWTRILGDIERACRAGDTTTLVQHDLSFHRAIIESHPDKDVVLLWTPVALRMLIHYERLGDLMESYREHKAIVDAVRAGDKRAALRALETNIQ